ncbi:uncharacterized protein HRG_02075 [Hirsutella rhossiliensis]|uniref:F-box domain-containing protein n=1 Tax=Hirsutella rhossiliensis TaxID=111463 RepID=A0A9P8SMZ9_9HYPO|nr:uncharacterized protein HRG_02075 [Hirsutella rhossiliensis]KAH0966666.1 hypothetical protein HRG_02075 [Hirsutella rhossiliensis]
MMTSSLSLMDKLPNEMLAATLALLSSRELALVVLVSRRFYSVGVRVLYRRLVDAARLPGHELILECYHPSAKISTPYLACRYLGTCVADGGAIDDGEPVLADLSKLYSSFRPSQSDVEEAASSQQQAGHADWHQIGEAWQEDDEDDDEDKDEIATQDIGLDRGELFSQLCTVTNVVKQSSRRGLFVSHVNTCDGVVRVWRKWLADMAASSPIGNGYDDDDNHGTSGEGSTTISRDRFLWVDAAKSVGLRFRVAPAAASAADNPPLLSGPHDDSEDEDDPAVSYTLVYQELLVRSSMLLSAVETSASQAVSRSTKAVIIAPFEGLVL